jgi:hypothetical protein
MRRVIRGFDAFLAKALGVFEFTQDPRCILRLQRAKLNHRLTLKGAGLAPGVPVLMLHLWNDRVPPLPAGGVNLAWARQISRSMTDSLHLAHACVLQELPQTHPLAIGAITVFGHASGTADILAHLGFLPHPYRSPLGRFGEWWENAYTWALMWTYNPASLRGKRLSRLRRTEYWMSTSDFLDRFHVV